METQKDIPATKLYDKDAKGVFRLIREASIEELTKAKLKNDPILVLSKSLEDAKETVLFIHGNKKGKKIYRAKRTDVSFDLRKDGNFADNLSSELKNKLLKV